MMWSKGWVGLAACCSLAGLLAPALAAGQAPATADWTFCPSAIQATERIARTPPRLLSAIGVVESGRLAPAAQGVVPWPWTINVGGQGHFYATKLDAIAAVQGLLVQGIHSIDVGCMQVNLQQHPDAFASLDIAFDPQANVAYAARFLNQLYRQTGDWPQAAAAYHSQTPAIGAEYERRVMAVWPLAARLPAEAAQFAPHVAPVAAPLPPVVSAIYTPEFARRLAQNAADRAARATAHSRGVQPSPSQQRMENIYTPEFAALRAEDAAARADRLASLHWAPPRDQVPPRLRQARAEVALQRSHRSGQRALD